MFIVYVVCGRSVDLRRSRLLIWHVGWIVVVFELIVYFLMGYLSAGYQQGIWKKFNEQAYTIEDVDSKTPYAESINRHAR